MLTIKRRFALLLPVALLAMASLASSASATTTVKDLSGKSCSAVSPAITPPANSLVFMWGARPTYSSGGCTVHVETYGAVHTLGKYSSGPTNWCKSSFDAHVGPNGWGYANNFVYNCEFPTTACPRTEYIAPAEYNPEKLFAYSNAATDLQMSFCGNVSFDGTPTSYYGAVSMDIAAYGAEGLESQIWTNQQKVAPSEGFRWVSYGRWASLKSGLTITH
jgi:hypothetical protein